MKAQLKKLNEGQSINWVMLVGVALSLLEHFTLLPEFEFVVADWQVWLLAVLAGGKAILGVVTQ